jgi:hypothetical protein
MYAFGLAVFMSLGEYRRHLTGARAKNDQRRARLARLEGRLDRDYFDVRSVDGFHARHWDDGEIEVLAEHKVVNVTSIDQEGGITAGVVLDSTSAQPSGLMPGRRTLPLLESDGETAWPDRHPHLWVLLRSVLPRALFRALVLRAIPERPAASGPGSLHEVAEREAFYARGASPSIDFWPVDRPRPSNTETR